MTIQFEDGRSACSAEPGSVCTFISPYDVYVVKGTSQQTARTPIDANRFVIHLHTSLVPLGKTYSGRITLHKGDGVL